MLHSNIVKKCIVAKWKKHHQLLKTQTARPLLDILLFCLNQRNHAFAQTNSVFHLVKIDSESDTKSNMIKRLHYHVHVYLYLSLVHRSGVIWCVRRH